MRKIEKIITEHSCVQDKSCVLRHQRPESPTPTCCDNNRKMKAEKVEIERDIVYYWIDNHHLNKIPIPQDSQCGMFTREPATKEL